MTFRGHRSEPDCYENRLVGVGVAVGVAVVVGVAVGVAVGFAVAVAVVVAVVVAVGVGVVVVVAVAVAVGTVTTTTLIYKAREDSYDQWLATLSNYEVQRLCHARLEVDRDRSLEEFLHEYFVAGIYDVMDLTYHVACLLEDIREPIIA